MLQNSSVNALNAINDYLKIEYPQAMRDEFNSMEAVINIIQKDQLKGKYKEKMFSLGIVDNMRALGQMWDTDSQAYNTPSTDKYALSLDDLHVDGVDTVTAKFDVTKFINTFSVTDEALLIGTTDGSLFNIVTDNLDRMNKGLKHTQARQLYGGKNGIIGGVVEAPTVDTTSIDGKTIVKVKVKNGNSILPGMQVMVAKKWKTGVNVDAADTDQLSFIEGKVFQKQKALKTDAVLWVIPDNTTIFKATAAGTLEAADIEAGAAGDIDDTYSLYSRQFNTANGIKREYQGLNDILISPPSNLFGVNLGLYVSLKSPVVDLENGLLTETKLDELSDHLEIENTEDSSIDLVVSQNHIISTIKQQFYGFKQYDLDSTSKDFSMGRKDVVYGQYRFHKDKYSRDQNIYMLDTKMIGELLRKDFGWITEGKNGILERRDGTEIYEAIMTKYGDLYIEGWKVHAAFVNAKEYSA